jgi:hypothetical protein
MGSDGGILGIGTPELVSLLFSVISVTRWRFPPRVLR